MSRVRTLTAALAVAAVAAAPVASLPAGPGALEDPAGVLASVCAPTASAAVTPLLDVGAMEVASTTIDGHVVDVVTDPSIAPGFPVPTLRTPAGSCAVEAVNLVLPGSDPVATGLFFARVAAMTHLGEVEVVDHRLDGSVLHVTTLGGRHGVEADWTIELDASGVRQATFEATRIGVGVTLDHGAGIEGVTALPGFGRTWTRDVTGLLQVDGSIAQDLAASAAERDAAAVNAARAAGLAPGDLLEHTFDDGFTIRLTLGVAATPVETVRTSVGVADRLINLRDGFVDHYEHFIGWGVDDPFDNTTRGFVVSTPVPDEAGYINLESGLSAYCLACAFLADRMEIHMAYAFPEIAPPLVNVSYPDVEAFFVDVMGHEMVHSLQGGYANGNNIFSNSMVEATARASEGLFTGAANSNQGGSIAYVDNANGCEGFENGRGGWITAQANGPFIGHTYDSCYFWWTYYAQHGGPGLVRLLESQPLVANDGNLAARNAALLDAASPVADGTLDLAFWAAAYTAGADADGYTIEANDGAAYEWFGLLNPLASRSTALGRTALDATVADAGTRGFEITVSGILTSLPVGAEAFLFEVVDGSIELVGPVAVGDAVTAGQLLSVVAPGEGRFAGQVAIG